MYKSLDRKQDVGHFFCLLHIDAFIEYAEFIRRVDETIDRLKSGKKMAGVAEILVPGERSTRTARENEKNGVPLGPETWKELEDWCKKLNVEMLPGTATGELMTDILISENISLDHSVDALSSKFQVSRQPNCGSTRPRSLKAVAGARALIVRKQDRCERRVVEGGQESDCRGTRRSGAGQH